MKKRRAASVAAVVVGLVVLLIHFFISPLADGLVRVVGVLELAAIFLTVFTSVRLGAKQR